MSNLERLVEELKSMHEAVLGGELREVREPDPVLRALEEGVGEIPLVLDWDEEPHSVVLTELRGERVVFFNGMSPEPAVEPGQPIDDQGPPRQAEEPGLESVSREEFVRLFTERGAICLMS